MIVVDVKIVDDSGLVTGHQVKTIESNYHWEINRAFEQLGEEIAQKVDANGGG